MTPRLGLVAAMAGMMLPALAAWGGETEHVRALVTARQHAVLSAQIAGKITRLEIRGGETVQKGQVLGQLDCGIQRAQLAEARAELIGADKILTVNRQLAGLHSGNALDAANAEAGAARARARVEAGEATLSMCDIRAPFDGRIVERKSEPFQHVGAGQAVVEIQDDRNLEIEMMIPSSWVTWIKAGTAFSLTVDETGQTVTGKITRLGVRIDPAAQSLKVVGEPVQPTPGLLPGMSGDAKFGNRP